MIYTTTDIDDCDMDDDTVHFTVMADVKEFQKKAILLVLSTFKQGATMLQFESKFLFIHLSYLHNKNMYTNLFTSKLILIYTPSFILQINTWS